MAISEQIIGFEIKGIGDFVRQFQTGTGRAAREFESRMGKATKVMEKTIKDAPEKMFGSESMKKIQRLYSNMEKSQLRTSKILHQMSMSNISKEERARLQGQLQREKKIQKNHLSLMKGEQDNLTRWGQRKQAAAKQVNSILDKGAKLQVDSITQGIEGAFSKLQGASVSDIISGLSGHASKAGKGAAKAGGKMAGGKGATKAMKAMGTAMKGLGAALGVFAGIAAILGVIVKIFMGLDKQVKDFNKELLSSGGAMDVAFKGGADAAESMETALGEIREASFDVSNNLKWMTTGKEQMEILKGFNEAGFRLKDMTANIKSAHERMQKYQEATAVALTYSKLLGVSSSQMAQDMGKIMSETGSNLEQVRDGFAKVARIAQESGFNVKRFYSTVLEATSGMHFYNVRIEESAALLKKFTDMLGKPIGTEMFKSMQEGFAEMDYKTRFKTLITAGGKNTTEIYDAAVTNAARKFGDTLDKNDALQRAMSAIGVDIGGTGDEAGKRMAKKFGAMSEKEFGATLSKLGMEGVGGEILQQLTTLRDVQKGATGGMGDRAKAMGSLDPGASMALKMANFMGPIHEMSALQLAAFEDFRGISGSQLESLRRMSRQFHGDFTVLKELGAKQAKGVDIDAENLKMAKKNGFAVDKENKIRKAQINEETGKIEFVGDEIKSVNALIAQQGHTIGEQMQLEKDAYTKDQILASRIVKNTEPLEKALEIGIQGWLQKIYNVMEPVASGIWNLVSHFTGMDALVDAVKSRQFHMQAATDEVQMIKEALSVLKSQKKDTEDLLAETKDPREAKVLQEKLAGIEKSLAETEVTLAGAKASHGALGKATVEDFKDAPKPTYGSALWSLMPGTGGMTIGRRGFAPEQKAAMARKAAMQAAGQSQGLDVKFGGASGDQYSGYKVEDDLKEIVEGDKAARKADEKRAEEQKKLQEKGIADASMAVKMTLAKNEEARKKHEEFQEDEFSKLPSENAREMYKLILRGRLGRLGLGSRTEDRLVSRLASDSSVDRRRGRQELAKYVNSAVSKLPTSEAKEQFVSPYMDYIGHTVTKTDDFILNQASGRLIQPSSDDTVVGLKPGGPLDKLLGARGGSPINVTINESHNTEKTYATVKKALRDAGLI